MNLQPTIYKMSEHVKRALAHRYLYYVECNSIISDYEYDMLEKTCIRKKYEGYEQLLVPGSDNSSHYSIEVKSMAMQLLTSK